ncbi:MAG: hypothetical protein WD737_10735 [Gemmatimonadota bacterium]
MSAQVQAGVLPSQNAEIILPPLPDWGTTRHGLKVDLRDEVWYVPTSPDGGAIMQVNFNALRWEEGRVLLRASERAIHILKLYLAAHLASKAASTLENDRKAVRYMIRYFADNPEALPCDKGQAFQFEALSESAMRAFLAHCLTTPNQGNDFSRIRTIYRWCTRVGLPGFSASLDLALRSIRSPGNSKGDSVRARDPLKGPLSPDERDATPTSFDTG